MGKIFSQVWQLTDLLESAHLDVRMAAGEALALVFEMGRTHCSDFQEDATPQLVDRLRQLATDSHKYRAKKDRKTQRSSFRDILHYVEVKHLFLQTSFKNSDNCNSSAMQMIVSLKFRLSILFLSLH